MKAIGFDVWKTLLNPDPFVRKFSQYLSLEVGLQGDEVYRLVIAAYEEIKRLRARGLIRENSIVSDSLSVVLRYVPGATKEKVRRALSKAVLTVDPKELVLDTADIVLGTIKELGYSIVTIGNVVYWPGSYTRLLLERTGLARLIDAQVYADEEMCSKPSPRIFDAAVKALREEGKTVGLLAHVGDNMREDFLGALSYGIKAVLIDRDGVFGRTLELIPGRGYIVKSLKEIPELARLWMINGQTYQD